MDTTADNTKGDSLQMLMCIERDYMEKLYRKRDYILSVFSSQNGVREEAQQ